jgi:methylmalonyl-CoA/ethylmalonyl-CoA epimerase
MHIDHVCIAVRSINRSAKRFCELFEYSIKTEKVANKSQEVNVQFLTKDGSMDIKLIEPSNPKSPLINFLKKGEGLHHLCFMSQEGVEKSVQMLVDKGAKVLAEPAPGEAFDGELISFIYAGSGLNVEIIDTEKRRGLLSDN